MRFSSVVLASLVGSISASPILQQRQTSGRYVADAKFDGQCFYPEADDDFELNEYLGRWYQIAGTSASFTQGCKCIYAEYSLNTNGTVNVQNGCEASGREINIQGTATPVSQEQGYGEGGLLRVQFPGQPEPECPGPNYIVQEIDQDDDDNDDDDDDYDGSWAIVQASNFTTLFLLSREQNPDRSLIDRWLNRAAALGSDLSQVEITDQSNCQFT